METFSLDRSAAEALIERSFRVVGNGPGLRAYTDFLAQYVHGRASQADFFLAKIAKADDLRINMRF